MKIGAYSPRTGQPIADDITGINFGNIHKGSHSVLPVLIRPEQEDGESFSGLEIYLQNNGGFGNTDYGYFVYSGFVPVKSWDPAVTGDSSYRYISDHFTVVPNPTEFSDGVHINVQDGFGDYVWLDVEPGPFETGGTSSINYRFLFEYS
jgi:hypothetical protein